MNSLRSAPVALCILLAVASCGGGGGGALSLAPDAAQDAAGAKPPAESTSEQEERSERITQQFDSLNLTSVHYQTPFPQLPRFVGNISCATTYCDLTVPALNYRDVISIESLRSTEFSGNENSQPVLTEHGITLIEHAWTETITFDGSDEVSRGNSLTGTLDHSEFGSITGSITIEEDQVLLRFAGAFGELADASPIASGVWRGQMSAVSQNSNDFLQGEATLIYSISSSRGELSADFTDITNLSRNTAHDYPSVQFRNVSVSSSGTYLQESFGSRIQGAFYGSRGVETAGTFEKHGMLAAFGARQQQ